MDAASLNGLDPNPHLVGAVGTIRWIVAGGGPVCAFFTPRPRRRRQVACLRAVCCACCPPAGHPRSALPAESQRLRYASKKKKQTRLQQIHHCSCTWYSHVKPIHASHTRLAMSPALPTHAFWNFFLLHVYPDVCVFCRLTYQCTL